jgi:hypothetical protein
MPAAATKVPHWKDACRGNRSRKRTSYLKNGCDDTPSELKTMLPLEYRFHKGGGRRFVSSFYFLKYRRVPLLV